MTHTTTLLLEVFTERNTVANDFYSKKRKKLLIKAPFGRLRGNVRTPSIAHWKARGLVPIRHN